MVKASNILKGLKWGATKSAPVLGKGAAAASAAGSAVQQAGGAVAYGAFNQVMGAAKNLSFLMLVLGIIHYLIRIYVVGLSTFSFVFSLTLFILAGYALGARVEKDRTAILIPMLIFVVWYFFFDGSYDPQFLTYFLSITAVLLLLPGLLTKGESVKPELYGLLPVLFLFLDIGLLPFLVQKFNLPITPLLEGLILYMPWWALFGLLTLPSDATQSGGANFLISLMKVVGIMYIIFIFVAPSIPNVGYGKGIIPGAGELEAAQAQLRARLPQGENPFLSNMACILSGESASIPACVEKRQLRSQLEATCEQREEVRSGAYPLEDCIADLEKKKQEELNVAGNVDQFIKDVTKAELSLGTGYELLYRAKDEELKTPYPATLSIKNPRKLPLDLTARCEFRSPKGDIGGVVSWRGEQMDSVHVDHDEELALTCTPAASLEGRYALVLDVTLGNVKTTSALKRVFIGAKEQEEKTTLIQQIMADEFSSASDIGSRAPAEFARINFGFGKTGNTPIIAADDAVFFISSIENVGAGNLSAIRSYHFTLQEKGFTVKSGSADCLQGTKVYPSESKTIPLRNCFLELPTALKEITHKYEEETFFAELVYDYTLRKEMQVEVRVRG